MSQPACKKLQPFICSLIQGNTSIRYGAKFQHSTNRKMNSIPEISRIQASVIPAVIAWILLCGEYVSLVSLRYSVKSPLSLPVCATMLHNAEDLISLAPSNRLSCDLSNNR